MWGLLARGKVDSDPVSRQFVVGRQEQAAQLLLEGLVEVEVDERVVDVRAFGEESREDEALRRHVPRLLVEYEEEGHDGVRRPGDHEPKTDAEEHLEEEVTILNCSNGRLFLNQHDTSGWFLRRPILSFTIEVNS